MCPWPPPHPPTPNPFSLHSFHLLLWSMSCFIPGLKFSQWECFHELWPSSQAGRDKWFCTQTVGCKQAIGIVCCCAVLSAGLDYSGRARDQWCVIIYPATYPLLGLGKLQNSKYWTAKEKKVIGHFRDSLTCFVLVQYWNNLLFYSVLLVAVSPCLES